MSKKKTIQHAIEQVHGPCPLEDFVKANEWANHIDWAMVKERVDAEHPDFEWTHGNASAVEAAESLITEVRHEMLHRAGDSPSGRE